jgi:ParB/RepB/Spo0J family partition protein
MTTSNAAADAEKTATAKIHEKLAEKRRALGRGLESLLPGPRRVVAPTPDETRSQVSGLRSQERGTSSSSSLGDEAGVSQTLDALQAVASSRSTDGEAVFVLETDQIDENPYQTRREFDQESLQELASSIQVQGVLQPIVVRPGTEGRYILILGERRLRASRMAGKTTIPVMVKRVSEQQAAEMTLVENLQRQDLNCVEQAEAFANLSKRFNLTQEEIGARAGISREQVSNYMRLLSLPEGVIGALQKGRLSYSHARTLLQLRDHAQIWKYAQRAMAEKMSVAKLEDLVLGVSAPTGLREASSGRWRKYWG